MFWIPISAIFSRIMLNMPSAGSTAVTCATFWAKGMSTSVNQIAYLLVIQLINKIYWSIYIMETSFTYSHSILKGAVR